METLLWIMGGIFAIWTFFKFFVKIKHVSPADIIKDNDEISDVMQPFTKAINNNTNNIKEMLKFLKHQDKINKANKEVQNQFLETIKWLKKEQENIGKNEREGK